MDISHAFRFEGASFRIDMELSVFPESFSFRGKAYRNGDLIGQVAGGGGRGAVERAHWTHQELRGSAVALAEEQVTMRRGITW